MATCNDSACPMHGTCHCGCGAKTWIATQSQTSYSHVRGMPAEYRSGHVPHGVGRANARRLQLIEEGGWAGTVRVAPLLPDIALLVKEYTQKGLARRLGVSPTAVSRWQHGSKQHYKGQRRGLLIRTTTAIKLGRLVDDVIFGTGSRKPEQLSFPELEAWILSHRVEVKKWHPTTQRAYQRYRARGTTVPLLWADRVACDELGVHPLYIWGISVYLGEDAA